MNLKEVLIDFLKQTSKPCKARDIAKQLGVDKKEINSVLYKGQDKYSELLEELNKHYIDDYDALPKQKDLLKIMGMKREELMSLLRQMYDNFLSEISRGGNYLIKETEIFVCTSNFYDESWVFSPSQLAYLPNVGDWITVPFIRDRLGGGHFKVKEVSHEIENQKHTINIIADDDLKSKG